MDSREAPYLTPAQCRARAELIRRTVAKASRPELRQELLEIAVQYDRLAGRPSRESGAVCLEVALREPARHASDKPTCFDRIMCLFGLHSWFYARGSNEARCLFCFKKKVLIPDPRWFWHGPEA